MPSLRDEIWALYATVSTLMRVEDIVYMRSKQYLQKHTEEVLYRCNDIQGVMQRLFIWLEFVYLLVKLKEQAMPNICEISFSFISNCTGIFRDF